LRLQTTGLPTRLKGDPSKLHQILMNLLSNAIKFTNEGQVTLNVKHSSTTNTLVNLIFTVTDTGCGVPESKIGLLFQEYFQLQNNRPNLDPGAGLGLYLTKKLTELMGGHICVYSKENYGSQFIVSIGFESAESSLPDADNKPSEKKNRKQPLSNFRLLVVDDNPVNQLVCETILLRSGAKVELAESGQIALSKLSEQHYDMILMDVYMPVLDGCQTTEQIRKSPIPHLQKIPILGLSAAGDPDTIRQCLRSGMNAHLLKSFQEEELLKQICILLPKVENQNESS
ncbi:MAG TPA: response regulator, partial [Bacteroidia bacterium]|nr:response regulator [Bacteroidia bacterium]